MMLEIITEFRGSDQAYFHWLERHPQGFVVNMHRHRLTKDAVLHRANCPVISQYTGKVRPGGFTERQYIKICSSNVLGLHHWAIQQGSKEGAFSKTCPICSPQNRPS